MMISLIVSAQLLAFSYIAQPPVTSEIVRDRASGFAGYLTAMDPSVSPLPLPYASIIFRVAGPDPQTGSWDVSTIAGDLKFFGNGQFSNFTRRTAGFGPVGTGSSILSSAELLQKAQSYWIVAYGEAFDLVESIVPPESIPNVQQPAYFQVSPKHRGIPFNPFGSGEIILDPENGNLWQLGCVRLPCVPASTSHIPALTFEESESIVAQAALQIDPTAVLVPAPPSGQARLTWTVPQPRSISTPPLNNLPNIYADKIASNEGILMYVTPLLALTPDSSNLVRRIFLGEVDAQTGALTSLVVLRDSGHLGATSFNRPGSSQHIQLGLDWGDGPTTILFQGKTLPTRGDVVTSNQPLGAGPAVNLGIRRGRMFLGAQYYPKTGLLQFRGMRGRPTGELAQALRKLVPARPQPESR